MHLSRAFLIALLSFTASNVNYAGVSLPQDATLPPQFYSRRINFVTGSSAAMTAGIQANQSEAVFWIEWGLDTLYGNQSILQAFRGSAYGAVVGFELKHLADSTTYHARFAASNDYGTTHDSDMIFTTLPDHELPDIVTLGADSLTTTSVRLHGRCNPNGTPTRIRFMVRPALDNAPLTQITAFRGIGDGRTDIDISETVSGLVPNMTYTFYFEADIYIPGVGSVGAKGEEGYFTTGYDSSSIGLFVPLQMTTNDGLNPMVIFGVHSFATACLDTAFAEFTLPPLPPGASTEMRLTGRCLDLGTYLDFRKYTSPEQLDTYRVHFQYGSYGSPITFSWPNLTTAYSGKVSLQTPYDLINMKAQTSFTITDPDLETFRIFAEGPNPSGPFPSIIMFNHPDGSNVSSVEALVKPNGHQTNAWFEWGSSILYGNSTVPHSVGDGETAAVASDLLSGVVPYKIYHVRAGAENSTGRVYSPDRLIVVGITTDAPPDHQLPATVQLFQNYPNPFNPVTSIEYTLSRRAFVVLKVYDILGREIRTLINGYQDPGFKSVKFDATSLPSGVYFYRLQGGNLITVRKMLLLR